MSQSPPTSDEYHDLPSDSPPERMNVGPGGSVDLANLFTYHPPFGDQPMRYTELRQTGLALANTVARLCPPGPERSTALAKIREAVMWANASIACNERESEDPS